jgi:hypothetical protein
MKLCYKSALERQPGLKGQLVLGWTIGRRGGARSVKREGGAIEDTSFVKCAAGAIQKTKFPRPRGRYARVRLPLVFGG